MVNWLDARCGKPAADVARSFVLIRPRAPDLAAAYVDAYAALGDTTSSQIMHWASIVAAARLAENAPAEATGLRALADRDP